MASIENCYMTGGWRIFLKRGFVPNSSGGFEAHDPTILTSSQEIIDRLQTENTHLKPWLSELGSPQLPQLFLGAEIKTHTGDFMGTYNQQFCIVLWRCPAIFMRWGHKLWPWRRRREWWSHSGGTFSDSVAKKMTTLWKKQSRCSLRI